MVFQKGQSNRKKEIAYEINNVGCWNCISHSLTTKGYPQIMRNYKLMRISRYMYEKHKGLIPKDKLVRHTCDNTLCINPEHLILGTYQDNSNDMVAHNRQAKGENHYNCKLTREKVQEILRSNKIFSDLARKYNISFTTIWQIKNRKTWKHVEV